MKPRTIITYLTNGNPSGVKTVEFSNRLIKGLSIPRKEFKEALKRKEINYSGVYFLLGEDEEGHNLAYIGQATVLKNRLINHYNDTNKDFWNTIVCFTYKDGSLTESDINYLEKEIITEAKKIGRYEIKNNTAGNNGLIQEHRIPDMEEFIDDLKILLVNLGYSVLKEIISKNQKNNDSKLYYLTGRGSDAKGLYTDEGFMVLKGSKGCKELVNLQIKNKGYAYKNRPKLLENGIIKEEGDNIIFMKDYLFSTPSGAFNMVSGSWGSGWYAWKDKNGKTLHENERQQIKE